MDPILIALGISLGINLLMFVPALFLKTDKLTDISYAATFATIAIFSYFPGRHGLENGILLGLILLWAARLGIFLLMRVLRTGKDSRFDGMRENPLAFLRFWVLQAIVAWAVSLPAIMFFSRSESLLPGDLAYLAAGAAIFFAGLLIEAIADAQKFAFSSDRKNKGKWISSGLWKYSRHPNYFGEILCWVGIYIYAFGALSPPQRILGIASPLLIALTLIFASGIPILEKRADEKWGKLKEYRKYKSQTPVLVPSPAQLIFSVAGCLGIGAFGGIATTSSVATWYPTLNKPFFNPPNWLFAPVWTLLYILMGVSLYLALRAGAGGKGKTLFAAQLALNLLWSLIFFGLRRPTFALACIALLWLAIFLTVREFGRFSKAAASLLIPYLLWVSFASLLNLSIVILN